MRTIAKLGYAPRKVALCGLLLWCAFAASTGLAQGIDANAATHSSSEAALAGNLKRLIVKAGPYSGAWVFDLNDEKQLFAHKSGVPRIPASNEKLLVTAAALARLGSQARIETAVYASGQRADTEWSGDLYLKGQGDPTFGEDDFVHGMFGSSGTKAGSLAGQLAETGLTDVAGRIYGDETYFDVRRGVAGTGFGASVYLPPLSALAFNSGYTDRTLRSYQSQPAKFAAGKLTEVLDADGIDVARNASTGGVPEQSTKIAAINSPPISRLVTLTNKGSNNYFAEMLIKQLGARFAGKGTTAKGAKVVRAFLREAGASGAVVDGSGLSRGDRVAPKEIGDLLVHMEGRPEFKAFRGSLPIAGKDGTLRKRMRGTVAQGRVRAKTGTLSGVSALSGYATTASGGSIAFSLLMNGVNPYSARAIQDAMAIAIAGYSG